MVISNLGLICHHFQDIRTETYMTITFTYDVELAKIRCKYANQKVKFDFLYDVNICPSQSVTVSEIITYEFSQKKILDFNV